MQSDKLPDTTSSTFEKETITSKTKQGRLNALSELRNDDDKLKQALNDELKQEKKDTDGTAERSHIKEDTVTRSSKLEDLVGQIKIDKRHNSESVKKSDSKDVSKRNSNTSTITATNQAKKETKTKSKTITKNDHDDSEEEELLSKHYIEPKVLSFFK